MIFVKIEAGRTPPEEQEIMMALTRKSLKAMGITDEQIESIIEMHTETTGAQQAQIDRLTAEAARVTALQKELDDANAKLSQNDPAAVASIKKEFDDYKAAVEAERTTAVKRAAYRKIVEGTGITGVLADMIAERADYGKLEMDGDRIKGAEEIGKELATTYAAYIPTQRTQGQMTQTPPPTQQQGSDDDLTDAEYFAKYKI